MFPLVFPRHSLIGLNHRALEHCLQTRLLSLAFDELCKPINRRAAQWRPENVAKIAQTSLLDWLHGTEIVETDQGKINRLER